MRAGPTLLKAARLLVRLIDSKAIARNMKGSEPISFVSTTNRTMMPPWFWLCYSYFVWICF